jgi:hypothetical protein
MTFTVVWLPQVQSRLAHIWLHASDRAAVTRASHEIDRLLRLRPLAVGTESGGARHLSVPPLEVGYSVSPDDCLVEVTHVIYVP